MHIYCFVVIENYYTLKIFNIHKKKTFSTLLHGNACLAKTFNNSCGSAFLLNHFVLCDLSQSPLL